MVSAVYVAMFGVAILLVFELTPRLASPGATGVAASLGLTALGFHAGALWMAAGLALLP